MGNRHESHGVTAKLFADDVIINAADAMRTQDFTMEGLHVVEAGPESMGTEFPQCGPGAKPRQ